MQDELIQTSSFEKQTAIVLLEKAHSCIENPGVLLILFLYFHRKQYKFIKHWYLSIMMLMVHKHY